MRTSGPRSPSANSIDFETAKPFNGFNDRYQLALTAGQWDAFPKQVPPVVIRDGSIKDPANTILFGEKQINALSPYFDMLIDQQDFYAKLAEARHNPSISDARRGGANYAFADQSVRFIRFGGATCPVNLLGVTESSRHDAALCRPR
jgi:hypothetical protein